MIKFPKFSAPLNEIYIPNRAQDYEWIENIQEYEFCSQVTFEMAIRNPEAIELLNMNYIFRYSPLTEIRKEVLLSKFGINDKCSFLYDAKITKKMYELEGSWDNSKYSITLDFLEDLTWTDENIKLTFEDFNCQYFKLCFYVYDNAQQYRPAGEVEIDGMTMLTNGIANLEQLYPFQTIKKYVKLYYTVVERIIIDENEQKTFIETSQDKKIDLDTLNSIEKLKLLDPPCIQFVLQELLKTQKVPKLSIEFIKPTLTIPTSNMVNIDINLSLPEEELCAYIKHVKSIVEHRTFEKIPKTPLQMIGSLFDEYIPTTSSKTISKELLADKFFVYDYISAKLAIGKTDEEELLTQEYDDEIAKIEDMAKRKIYNKETQKVRLKDLREEYHKNLREIKDHQIKVCDLFKDEELLSQINKSDSSASDYYYEMREYIEKLEYKYATFILKKPKRESKKSKEAKK